MVITYDEYCNSLGITPETPVEWTNPITHEEEHEAPDWFRVTQRKAIRLIKKSLAQSHLVPDSRLKLSMLKKRFLPAVIEGISQQIKFMYENEVVFDMGWLNADNSFNVGRYSQGPMAQSNIKKIFGGLCPLAFDCFDEIGWTYAGLIYQLKIEDYYDLSKGFKEGLEWE